MDMVQVDEAVAECGRFLRRVDELKTAIIQQIEDEKREARADKIPLKGQAEYKRDAEYHIFSGTGESGAVKRASMDLSRTLVKLRK